MAFAREGADVALGARTESYLEEVHGEIEALGRRAVHVRTDITDQGQCDALVQATVDAFGGVDVLVHNAFAPDVFQPFEDVDLAAWRQIMDVNLFGSLQLTKSAIPQMKAQESGSIVFVNSMIMRKVLPLQGGYATSKGALDDRGAGARQGARPAQDPRQLDRAGLDVGPGRADVHRDAGLGVGEDRTGPLRRDRGRDPAGRDPARRRLRERRGVLRVRPVLGDHGAVARRQRRRGLPSRARGSRAGDRRSRQPRARRGRSRARRGPRGRRPQAPARAGRDPRHRARRSHVRRWVVPAAAGA